MKENKNIERLFQEKFKDFEVTPITTPISIPSVSGSSIEAAIPKMPTVTN